LNRFFRIISLKVFINIDHYNNQEKRLFYLLFKLALIQYLKYYIFLVSLHLSFYQHFY